MTGILPDLEDRDHPDHGDNPAACDQCDDTGYTTRVSADGTAWFEPCRKCWRWQ